jgi:hypothetical protein
MKTVTDVCIGSLLHNFAAPDYIVQFTIVHRLIFSVALLGNGFQLRIQVITGWKLSAAASGQQIGS